jgi:hypothetical protein
VADGEDGAYRLVDAEDLARVVRPFVLRREGGKLVAGRGLVRSHLSPHVQISLPLQSHGR